MSKGRDGAVEAIRALMVAKRSAKSERTQTINQARAMVLTGPDALRTQLAGLDASEFVAKVAALRPRQGEIVDYATRMAVRELGRRVEFLDEQLKRLDEKGVAVRFTPYPEANGKQFWWANRPGIHGSAALYRLLFDRLVNHDGIHNLIWDWFADSPSFGPTGPGFEMCRALALVVTVALVATRVTKAVADTVDLIDIRTLHPLIGRTRKGWRRSSTMPDRNGFERSAENMLRPVKPTPM